MSESTGWKTKKQSKSLKLEFLEDPWSQTKEIMLGVGLQKSSNILTWRCKQAENIHWIHWVTECNVFENFWMMFLISRMPWHEQYMMMGNLQYLFFRVSSGEYVDSWWSLWCIRESEVYIGDQFMAGSLSTCQHYTSIHTLTTHCCWFLCIHLWHIYTWYSRWFATRWFQLYIQ